MPSPTKKSKKKKGTKKCVSKHALKGSSSRTNPFAAFETDIVEQIIQPKLTDVINSLDNPSKGDVYNAFRKATGSTCSIATFNHWLKILGWKFERSHGAILHTSSGSSPARSTNLTTLQAAKMVETARQRGPLDSEPVGAIDQLGQDLPGLPLTQKGEQEASPAVAGRVPAPSGEVLAEQVAINPGLARGKSPQDRALMGFGVPAGV